MHIVARHQPLMLTATFLLALLPILSGFAQAPDSSPAWNRFRGTNGTAYIDTCHVPLPWKDQDECWQIELPGKGNGSPIVQDGKVYVFSADANSAERYLLALDLKTGRELWKKTYASQPYHLHARSSYASCTPCSNEKAVFVAWASPENLTLKALDVDDGTELWTKNLDRYISQHGFGASPVLFDNRLILFNSQQAQELPPGVEPGKSRVQCFDATTGNLLWETPRTATRACYGAPVRFQDVSGKDALLFCNTGDGLFALELETGKPLWNRPVLKKRSVSCPMIVGDLAFCSEGSGGGGNVLFAVNLKGDHELRFQVERAAPYVPTPVARDNLLFLWSDNGIVTCLKLPQNEVAWTERIGGNVSSSPVIAGDKLIGIAEDGTLTVLAASTEFQEFGSISLGDTVRATPLLNKDYILIRTDSKLMCIGQP